MKKIKKAFTLAEIMIALTVIGVLAAMVMPATFHSISNKNIMKFKKTSNSLASTIRELALNENYKNEREKI